MNELPITQSDNRERTEALEAQMEVLSQRIHYLECQQKSKPKRRRNPWMKPLPRR